MKVLCVAEKPSVARSISSILSGGTSTMRKYYDQSNFDFEYKQFGPYTVTSVRGHLTGIDFDDSCRNWKSCDPDDLFEARIINFVSKDMTRIKQNLQNEARNSSKLVIWTDCDREGEHIGSEIANVCVGVNPRIQVKRARFSALIADQVHRAAQHLYDLDTLQVAAVETRMELDLRIGAAFTRFQTMSLQTQLNLDYVVSYGPCQFPALGFVVDRYDRIANFVPEPYWSIHLAVNVDDQNIAFTWERSHLFDYHSAFIIFEDCIDHGEAKVSHVDTKPTKKFKPLPLTTVELQKVASRLLHISPQRVMTVSEDLYNKGFISYPRTETDQFDKKFDFNRIIEKYRNDPDMGAHAISLLDGDEFEIPRNGTKNDEAHPPIHPIAHVTNLTGDDKKIYEYISRRFLACCSKNATGKQTTVKVKLGEETFHKSGLIVLERHYLNVFTYETWSTNELPHFQVGDTFVPSECKLNESKTAPPVLLTEADLVGLMDANGIGTDATIAEHIDRIIKRQYVQRIKKGKTNYLAPSELGIGLVHGYNQIGFDKSLTKPLLRRECELLLTEICQGRSSKQEALDSSVEQYRQMFTQVRESFDQCIVTSVQAYLSSGLHDVMRKGNHMFDGMLGGNDGNDDDDDSNGDDQDNDNPSTTNNRGRKRARGGSTRGVSNKRGRGGGGRGRGRVSKKSSAGTSNDNSNGRSNDKCYKCGKTGHWANACPTKN